jgi:hypothetical protein
MRRFFCVTAVALFLAFPAPASAQLRPDRPYRGLFGGAAAPTGVGHSLAVSASVGAGFDDNALGARGIDAFRPSDFNRTVRGTTGYASGSLQYGLGLGRVSLYASATTIGRYYEELRPSLLRRDYLHAGASVGVFGGLSLYGSTTYAPYDVGRMFGELPIPDAGDSLDTVAPDVTLPSSTEHYFSTNLGIRLSKSIPVSRRGSVTGSYRIQRRQSDVEDGALLVDDREIPTAIGRDYRGHTGRIAYVHRVSQNLSLRAGYRFDQAWYEDIDTVTLHIIDLGVLYNRSLSFSRRTSVAFRTGTVVTDNPTGVGDPGLQLIGRAVLTHELGRSWDATLTYNRGVSLSETWPEPISYDAIIARVGGLLSRRMQFDATARTARGNSGFNYTASNSFDWIAAGAFLGVALTRQVNVGLRYLYYMHDFGSATLLAPGIPHDVGRHSAGVHVTFWAPLIQPRNGHATR